MTRANWLNDGSKVDWDSFDQYKETDKYLPDEGEGDNKATQTATAVSKLIYKWFNDGDVYDNTHYMTGWANDLSTYANWLSTYIEGADDILEQINYAYNDDQYSRILLKLIQLVEPMYKELETEPKVDSVYKTKGPFEFAEENEDDYDDDYEENEEEE